MTSNNDPDLFTVGYGARGRDELITLLERLRIDYLIDVRSAPYSKFKPEFSKDPLGRAMQASDIRYVFLGDLLGGRPDDPNCYINGKVSYERVRETEAFRTGIERVRNGVAQGFKLCLMCSEGRPEACHRTKLIGNHLEELGMTVRHIDVDDSLVSQDQVMQRITGGQEDLFGPSLSSRKRYQQ